MTKNMKPNVEWSAISRIKYIAWQGIIAGQCGVLAFHHCSAWSDDLSIKPIIGFSRDSLRIKTPAGKNQVIPIGHAVSPSDIILENFTFGKYADLKILDTEGASQKFYKVYLYDTSSGLYRYSNKLSAIPCVQADAKKKEIVGACFHESACENWEERYTMGKNGNLTLVKRSGTYCDAAGQGYFYTDIYKNGKKIFSAVKPAEDNSPGSQ